MTTRANNQPQTDRRPRRAWKHALAMLMAALLLATLAPLSTLDAQQTAALQIETGTVPGVTNEWQTVQLSGGYQTLVVVATVQLPSPQAAPAVARIRNAQGSSFDIRLQNPSDADVGPYDVRFFAVEAGVYTQETDGITMEAALVDSTETARRGRWVREERTYANSYVQPVVFGQVMTENDPAWSVFWASAADDRTSPPTATSFAAGKNVSEDTNRTRADELIGYVVVEAGVGFMAGTRYEANLGTDTIAGVTNQIRSYDLSAGLLETGAALSTAGMDGGNGGWPVLIGDTPITASSLTAAFDEDQIRDAERSHTTEQVAYIVFGSGF